MAEAAVELLLENLKDLLLYHADLISDTKNQVEKLEFDLRLFKAFLRDSSKMRRTDGSLRELDRQIRDVVYEADDIIDAFVTQAAERESKIRFGRTLLTPVNLLGILKDVEKISVKVREIYDMRRFDFATLGARDWGLGETKVSIVKQEIVVGFEDEAQTLLRCLTEETEQLDIISIIGIGGLGKTTLANKIYHDPHIQFEFPTRIWVNVSEEFTKRNVFLTILREITRLTGDIYRKTDQELAQLITCHLDKGKGKFLIVMDDVWTNEDWDKLKIALPESNKMGKVLITSRNLEVARHVCRWRNPHKLRFLNADESWLLLRLEVFGKPEFPAELEVIGELISQLCGGLPLALVVLGGLLVKNSSTSYELNAWEKVCRSVCTYHNEDLLRRIISLSYDKLPSHLRACFLYFGMFPENCEIPVWKLIRMWIAEGIIQQKTSTSLEETAENYLVDLISRKLVKVGKLKADGKVKTCSIHDILHDFCKSEAGNEGENFFQEIKYSEGIEPPVSAVCNYRRLCIHSKLSNFLSSKPYGPRVRSFVCFSNEDVYLLPEHCSSIPAAFKLLRVLDVNPVKFTKFPRGLFHLVHLKYIAVSLNISVLPEALSRLWNIQTLIVDTESRTLQIKANIWRMFQLRHLKTNASVTLTKVGRSSDRSSKEGEKLQSLGTISPLNCTEEGESSDRSKEGEKLQSLGTISPLNCTEEVFSVARNLKKLGIRGRLSFLIAGKAGSFDSLCRLGNLEKLKLLNDVFPSLPSEGQLHCLPACHKFPPKLRSLTLANTFLDWSQISILGLLENLEVLKLKDEAFMGKFWEAADGGFRKLEVLYIGRTDLVVWKAAGHHFPSLRRLELRNCEDLREVPIGLVDIPSLEVLEVYRSKLAASSCKKIYDLKLKEEEMTGKVAMLKLSIFPPDL